MHTQMVLHSIELFAMRSRLATARHGPFITSNLMFGTHFQSSLGGFPPHQPTKAHKFKIISSFTDNMLRSAITQPTGGGGRGEKKKRTTTSKGTCFNYSPGQGQVSYFFCLFFAFFIPRAALFLTQCIGQVCVLQTQTWPCSTPSTHLQMHDCAP